LPAIGNLMVRREEGKMVEGAMVLVISVVILAAIWAIVLYGSSFFGPRVD
jgi:hypothetical protein